MATPLLGQPLAGGYLQPLSPNCSKEEQTFAINEIVNRLNDLLQTQVFSDGTSKRMLIGYQKNGWGPGKDFGIKISMVGIDVTQATHAQLLFSMDMATWQWFDPTGRNFVNIGLRSTGTHGFEMAKPTQALVDPNA